MLRLVLRRNMVISVQRLARGRGEPRTQQKPPKVVPEKVEPETDTSTDGQKNFTQKMAEKR